VLKSSPGKFFAEYRPALTDAGAVGKEVEIFVYEHLGGGAGLLTQFRGIPRNLCSREPEDPRNVSSQLRQFLLPLLRSFRNQD